MHTNRPNDVVIVGAGPAGLTAAAELLDTQFQITLLEKDTTYVGGISRTVVYKGYRFDIGGHRFFSKNPEISRWWRQRLPCDFIKVKRRSRILYRGKFYDYPLRPSNALRNLGILTSSACVLSYIASRLHPTRPEATFEEWVSNRFGRRLFEIFFRTYTEKVWGIPCSRISADWASQRIKGLSLKRAFTQAFRGKNEAESVVKTLIDEFEYPRLGPGMMWEKTRDDLVKSGVRIEMGRDVVGICHSGGAIQSLTTVVNGSPNEEWHGREFVISMPLRETVLSLTPSLPEEVRNAALALKYRDFITVALIVRGEGLFSDNWIYIHDPKVRVGRIQNFNNWSRDMVPIPGFTCLGLEYFCNQGDQLWNESDANLTEMARAETSRIGLVNPEKVVDGCVVRVEKAYPVYDPHYERNVTIIREGLASFRNLQVVGRNGMHKYNNQDHSMMTGLLAARNLKGGHFDPWRVNTDAEYHEEES